MKSYKPPIQSKLPHVKTTIFTTVGRLALAHNALNLSQGFPNFDPDPNLLKLVSKAMQNGHNQYAPMPGLPQLREVIAHKIKNLHQAEYDPEEEITITVGATQAIFSAITAFVRPGDEVIVIKPAYDCYEPAIEVNGGIPVFVQLSSMDFKVDWEALRCAINTKTKMVIINTPHNPSGHILTKTDMLKLQEILRDTPTILISDEVYEHIVFDGKAHESASRFEDLASRCFVCASFGKTFHVTGWKMGYCAAPAALMHEFRKTHQFNVFSVDHPVQWAMAEYLENEAHYMELNTFYQKKRDLFLGGLQKSRFKFTPSEGTYFQLLDYSNISDESDVVLAKRLTIENKLASIPMSVFNVDQRDDKLLRFCFAKTEDTLEKATAILNTI
ncbi:MAG: aminotransferase class I/II-fold pyridoxal phosphate-dependent enzyme [Flavobacteriales bacterium]|nr:MAG: aminotransferase class I/II-fold pyridoxal phosphate-dependent enzyme [Flavobacteriales bacterium]